MDDDSYDAILNNIFKQTQGHEPSEQNVGAGVCLRVETGVFRVFPSANHHLEKFEAEVKKLNPLVAVKVRSAAVQAALASLTEEDTAIKFPSIDTGIQVLDTITDLHCADKEQCAAFIRDESVLVVWSGILESIIPTCREFEQMLIKLVWRRRA
ncbi:hypothetical protein BD410DRAFT_786853 [Rickenella mellea]|uniref:DUF7928 domain-containing protein n=1 Tax=Rickenella mellea TaxID=50990 RepID=A0A4Y7Q7I6_9AGAM|nr:hypothetical protein BD410DRAFT_786853 [Rickenella mellea]